MQIYQYLSKYVHFFWTKSPNIRTLFSECSYMNTNKPQQIWLNMNVCFYSIHSLSRISMRSRRLQRIKLTQLNILTFHIHHNPFTLVVSTVCTVSFKKSDGGSKKVRDRAGFCFAVYLQSLFNDRSTHLSIIPLARWGMNPAFWLVEVLFHCHRLI